MREIILDTETTGLSPAQERLVEIGCVEMVNRIATGRTFHVYINPEKEVSAGAVAVHGLTGDFLADKPKFSEIYEEFLEFIADSPLVIHNAPFDMGFINMELKRVDRAPIPMDNVVDTLLIARRKHTGAGNRLDDLCTRYGIDNKHRTKHGALLDAEILSLVYVELMGGRQTQLDLSGQGTASQFTSNTPQSSQTMGAAQQRPAPLPARIQIDEIAAHVEFVSGMSEVAVWKRYR